MKLGFAIKAARLSAGWTAAELADRAGLSSATLSLVEKGDRTPSMDAAGAIAKALDMPLWALMKLAEEQKDKLDKMQEIQLDLIKAALAIRHRVKTRDTARSRPATARR